VKNLYPEISKALIHFISEAKRHNQIVEEDAFGTPPNRNIDQNLAQEAQSSSSAFGSFKMNAIVEQPSSPPTA